MTGTPPETERREVVETLHGDEVVDPYRWLEADDEAVAEWTARQNEYADAILDTGTRSALAPRIESVARVAAYGPVTVRGGRYFQRIEGTDEDRPALTVREDPAGEPRTLVDPNGFEDEAQSMDWYTPSPDGDLVAYGVAEGGDEQYDVTVLDVGTGEAVHELPDAGRTGGYMWAWSDDGFHYVRMGDVGGGGQLQKDLRHRDLETGEERVVADGFGPSVIPVLDADPATGTVLVTESEMSQYDEVYVLDGDELRPVFVGEEATFGVAFGDGVAYVWTNHDAPRGRVLACPVEALHDGPLDPDDLAVVVPEGEAVLRDVVVAGDRLVALHHRDAVSTLTAYGPDGDREWELPLPEHATVSGRNGDLTADPDRPECFYRVQTFDRPPRVVRADLAAETTEVLQEPDVGVDAEIEVEQHRYESADGTEVPVFVAHRADLDRDGDNPAVLYGYGGFRSNVTPSFDRFRGPFLADGGVWAQACLRGGSEFGEPWHRDGMLERKQHTFDDFLAAAGFLCDAGYTRPERLACWGRSNGGLTVGAAITQRPGGFAAALCGVPLLDMLRFHRFLLGESWTTEYGSPDDPGSYEYIREYSPYHNVGARDYPSVLFHTATGDSRVHPSHARKMTALLQERSTSGEPILLRTRESTGHGVGKPTSMVVEERLDEWTFLYDRLGLEPERERRGPA